MAECIAYMKDPQNRIFIDSIDEHTTVDKMSDFECFAFLCSSVDDIIHSRFGRNFFELLRRDFGADGIIPELHDKEVQKLVWRNLHGDTVVIGEQALKDKSVDIKTEKREFVDIRELLNDRARFPNDLNGFIDSLPEEIFVDADCLEYSTPDEYHAELAYKTLCEGKTLSVRERSVLILWAVCKRTLKGHVKLWIRCNNDVDFVRELLTLVVRRHLSIQAVLLADTEQAVCSSAELLLEMSKIKKTVFPKLALCEKTVDSNILNKALELLPVTRICFLRESLEKRW